ALIRAQPEAAARASARALSALAADPAARYEAPLLAPAERHQGLAAGSAAPSAPQVCELEELVAALWAEVLERERVGRADNFFDLGGHSLLLLRVQARLEQALGREVPMLELFRRPTVAALAAWLAGVPEAEPAPPRPAVAVEGNAVAIVGMAGRFPGAVDLESFWKNLKDGVESITF